MSNFQELINQLSLDGSSVKVQSSPHLNDGFNALPSVSSRELILVNANVSQQVLLEMLGRCGEVKHLSKPADMQQVWYAVYYDVRAAQIAVSTYHGNSIDGVQAPVEIHIHINTTFGMAVEHIMLL
eukprot:TRINITY_DN14210_c0_g1_i5.p1 TRINITY_DN14210_c0_g1~~TRINITY_DN14210_c0_g1_i5.p1  ORF type:complete len:126 (-),score=18.94 TRINITY_DN14210_c0_g1_i5:44-421(-)